MAEINFRNLIPGKRYKIVIKPSTVFGTIDSFPSIDFIVPEAPPRARNYRLTANTVVSVKVLKKRNRRLKINKYKIEPNNQGGFTVVLITAKAKNRVKPGSFIKVQLNSDPNAINVDPARVLSRSKKNKNRVRYYHPTGKYSNGTNLPSGGIGWTSVPDSNEPTNGALVHIDGGLLTIKKKKVRLRIPKPILQNLTWNDDVRDFVFVIYRKGKKRSKLANRRYYWDTDAAQLDVKNAKPPLVTGAGAVGNTVINDTLVQINLDSSSAVPYFKDGHPATFVKEINDDQFYQFEFIVARYIKTYDETLNNNTGGYMWTGYWIERNSSFLKKLSRPVSWRNK